MEVGTSQGVDFTDAGAALPVKTGSRRGRKKDLSLPPSRSREIQRAFRARKAAQLEWLQNRVRMLEEENNELRKRLGEPPREDIDPSMTTPGKLGFKDIADVYVDQMPPGHVNGHDGNRSSTHEDIDGSPDDDANVHDVATAAAVAAAAAHQLPYDAAVAGAHPDWAVQAMLDPSQSLLEQPHQVEHMQHEQPHEHSEYHEEPQTQDEANELIHQALANQVRPMQGRRPLPLRPPPPSSQVELRFLSTACGYGDVKPDFATDAFAIFCLALMQGLELTGKGELERTSWSLGEQRMLESGEKSERECCDGLFDCSDSMFDNATPEGYVSVHEAWHLLEPFTRQPDLSEATDEMGEYLEEDLASDPARSGLSIPAQALASALLNLGGPGSEYVSTNVRLEDERGLLVLESAAKKARKAAQAFRNQKLQAWRESRQA